MVLLPGPGDRPHPQPTPPDSTSRPTTPPQAFQPQPPPVTPLTSLPASEAEELQQLCLQFQQQQHTTHHLQQQALLHSTFNPFFSPFQFYLPTPTAPPSHPPTGPPPANGSPTAPEPAPAATEPVDLSISLFPTQASTQPPTSNQADSAHRSPHRPIRPETPPRLSLHWSRHQPDFTTLEHSAKLGYFMNNILEVAIEISPQKQIWTTPFWLHIRPSGPVC